MLLEKILTFIYYIYFCKKYSNCLFPPHPFFQIHIIGHNWCKGNIIKVLRFLITILVQLSVKLIQHHVWFGVYQIRTQHILVQKFKIVSLRWNFAPRPVQICRIQCWWPLFLFQTEIPFWGKFGQKNQNCLFRRKIRHLA